MDTTIPLVAPGPLSFPSGVFPNVVQGARAAWFVFCRISMGLFGLRSNWIESINVLSFNITWTLFYNCNFFFFPVVMVPPFPPGGFRDPCPFPSSALFLLCLGVSPLLLRGCLFLFFSPFWRGFPPPFFNFWLHLRHGFLMRRYFSPPFHPPSSVLIVVWAFPPPSVFFLLCKRIVYVFPSKTYRLLTFFFPSELPSVLRPFFPPFKLLPFPDLVPSFDLIRLFFLLQPIGNSVHTVFHGPPLSDSPFPRLVAV